MIKGHSEKWRSLQAEHLDRMRAQLAGRRASTAAQFTRGRPAQVTDNAQQHSKNRWSFEVKQRELEEAEELRRQAILTIRKAELRDATERFQRATSPRRSRPPSPARQRPSSAPASRLHAHTTTVTPTLPVAAQLGQPVVGSWVPAAATADGKASVAFAKKYGSHNEEQQREQFEVIDTISAASSRKYGQPLQSVVSNETIHVHGGSSAAFRQQRRHSTAWAPAWIASTDLPPGRQPSPAAAASEGATPLGSQSPSQRQTLVPARAARPSSAGAVMVGTEWQATAVASGSASTAASVEQRRSLGRPTVTIPHVSAEPCADVDDAAVGDSSSVSSAATDEWLAADTLTTTRFETGRPQSPKRLLSHATRDAPEFSHSDVGSDPSSLKKAIDAAAVVSAEAALACDVASSQSLSKTPKIVSSGAAGAAADLPVCSPSSHLLAGSNGAYERSSRTTEPDGAASSVETASIVVRDGYQHAPVPPRGSRPPELLHLRRPASADGARLRAAPAASSAAASSENAAVAANAATFPVVGASSNTSSSGTEAAGQLPVDAVTRFGLYYVKSRTDSRLKEIVPGPPSGGDLGQILLADSAALGFSPSRGHGPPDRNSSKADGRNRRDNQIGQPDRTEGSASTSAAAAANTAADAAAAIDDRRVTKGLRVDNSLSSATSAARPRSAPGTRSSAAENDFFSNAGDETLTHIGSSLVGESELKQPRSILKRPMSGHGVASSAGGNGIHSLDTIKDAHTTGSHDHGIAPLVSNDGRNEGGTRRKSVRFSDDDSRQLVQRLQASAFDGMNGLLGGVGGGGGSGGDAAASEARTLRPTVGQPDRSAAHLLTSQQQTKSGADVVAPANSPACDTNGSTVVGDQLTNATTSIATSTDDVAHAYFKSDAMQLKREQQPRRVLPPATSVTLQSEQRPLQQQLVPNQQLAAQLVVPQAWQNKQLHQPEAVPTATPSVMPLMVSPNRAAMPAMSVFFPVEEQRLLNALEVLNRRLKINEDVTLSDRGTSAQNTRASTYKGHLSRSASQQDGTDTDVS